MTLLEFTKAYDAAQLRGPVSVNPEMVIGVEKDYKSGGSTIWCLDGKLFSVAEEYLDVVFDLQEGVEDGTDE